MEGGEGGGGEGGGIDGRRAAGDFGEEGAEVAEEGEDAEDGTESGAESGELFGHGDHCCGDSASVSAPVVKGWMWRREGGTYQRNLSEWPCMYSRASEQSPRMHPPGFLSFGT